MKKNKHRIISIDAEKEFDKFQCLLIIKILSTLEIKGSDSERTSTEYLELTANIILNSGIILNVIVARDSTLLRSRAR